MREGEERAKDTRLLGIPGGGGVGGAGGVEGLEWDKHFRLLEKHWNHSVRTWLNPKFIFSNFFVVKE